MQAVTISEVAWMGDSVSANNEWIELYNNTGSDVDLAAWTLTDGLNLNIMLTGVIPDNTYRVLERSRGSGAYVSIPPFLTYSGALINTGATLTLRRGDGTVADQVVGGENWSTIGGDNTTKETAQYTTAGWRTGVATPGTTNISASTPVVTTPTTTTSITTTRTNGNNTGKLAVGTPVTPIKLVRPTLDLSLMVSAPAVAYVNQPVSFVAIPSGLGQTWLDSLTYRWSFGDLASGSVRSLSHTFRYPGTYIVTVEGSYQRYKAIARHEVTVLPVILSLAWSDDGMIFLHNDLPHEVDISGYRLMGGIGKRVPQNTVISARGTVTISPDLIGAVPGSTLSLTDTAGKVVATYPSNKTHSMDNMVEAKPKVTNGNMVETVSEATPVESLLVLGDVTMPLATTTAVLPLLPTMYDADGLPAYVLAALQEPAKTTSVGPASVPPVWPYAALGIILLGAIGAVLATSPTLRSNP